MFRAKRFYAKNTVSTMYGRFFNDTKHCLVSTHRIFSSLSDDRTLKDRIVDLSTILQRAPNSGRNGSSDIKPGCGIVYTFVCCE